MQSMIESFESRVLMSATPLLTSTQKQDIKAITKTLTTIYANSDITAAELAAVATDVTSILKVAQKPSSASVTKLKTDTKAAFADKVITPAEKIELTADVNAVLVSAEVPTALAEQTAADVAAVITSSNVTKAEANKLVSEVAAFLKTFKA